MTLRKFEHRPVEASAIQVTNAGDGLSQAMQVDPQELGIGDTVYVVIEATVDQVRYKRNKETNGLTRVHTLKAGTATLVDAALVKDVLEEQRIKIEESLGIERLDFGDGDDGGE